MHLSAGMSASCHTCMSDFSCMDLDRYRLRQQQSVTSMRGAAFACMSSGNVAESFPASHKRVHVEIGAVPACRCADILLIFLA